MTAITQNGSRWDVTGDILMDNANTLLKLSKGLALSEQTVVDFAKVVEVDTAAVSLILEWQRRAAAEGKQVSFEHLPKSLNSLTALYGVDDMIS